MIWSVLPSLIAAGFGVACLYSVRAACLAALEMLRSYLDSDMRGEITHLRAQVAAKDEQLLGIHHPQTQATLATQKAPERRYEPAWDAAGARPRNPEQIVVSLPGDVRAD